MNIRDLTNKILMADDAEFMDVQDEMMGCAHKFTDNDWPDRHPAWSPDGSKIAFVSYRDRDYEIYIMNADGSGIQQLTDNDWDDYFTAWLP